MSSDRIKMSFKGIEFPSNPEKIEITAKRDVLVTPVYEEESRVKNISREPIIVKGEGKFCGDEARENASFLSKLAGSDTPGELICPGLYPIRAYFSSFCYELDAEDGRVKYSFEFTQETDGKKETAPVYYTEAATGENAFDIAARCAVSVDDIMQKNSFKTPFDIAEGAKVNLI